MGAAALDRREAELERRIDALLAASEVRAVPDPVAWYERVTGKHADPWQQRFMRSDAPASLLVAGRQVGKTEAVAARATYRALFWPRRVGVLSPTLRQSSIVYRRCKALLVAARATLSRVTLTELEMPHGGSIVAFPGDRPDLAIRGDTLDDLIVDEAGFVRDALITAASPTLATRPGATLTLLGTPAGQRGKFHEEWSRGDGWERTLVRSDECPRITAAFLARERRRLGPMFAQEYEGAFLSAPGALFAADDLAAMFSLPAIEGGVELLDAPREAELSF
jgi:hypothetical protein